MKSFLLFSLIRIMSSLPLSLLQASSGLLFKLLKNSKTARYARLNIDIALPQYSEQQRAQIYQQAMQNEIQSYLEFLKIWGNSTQQNIALIQNVTGQEYLQQALERKKGVVIVIPHFGTWEVMNAWLSQFTPMTIMYKPAKNAAANQYVLQARAREQMTLVPTDESGVKQIFKTLKQGGVTAILPDHSPDHEGGEMYDWFGVPLYSSQLSAKLIQKTQASALLLYTLRNQHGGFDITIQPFPDDIYDKQNDGTTILLNRIQTLILNQPQHYHWSYKRFKANPKTGYLYTMPEKDALDLIRNIQKQ
ncbi:MULTISPECIES: lysophospholipid acyltransferase family protein [unclassified Acinetobacter]|uniref:lysophospholipid acyltransferase family protein n=1 Tax=unclassified Acinetobacter TaxID=196816 RepID=UPI0035B7789F